MRLCASLYSIPHNAQLLNGDGFGLCGWWNSRYQKEPSERH